MRTELVEIYSDWSNMAVMRHPGRRYPGVLFQGDTLDHLCRMMETVCAALDKTSQAHEVALELQEELQDRLDHYNEVLAPHGMSLA